MDAALPPLIQRMLQPDFYPHPVQTPVQLLQTHISYVFLTGEFAYKVKKSTQFGFLDFTNLEKRAYFCQTELRLNRRLSPNLYLAVLPIYQSQDSFHLNPNPQAEIADYALKMRQFPQEGLFSHLFKANKLTSEHLSKLGKIVAEFHTTATTNLEIQTYGTYAAICRTDEDNYNISKSFINQSQTPDQFQNTQAFTQQFWQTHQARITQRQSHSIRECHGDLHLNNVCLFQDQIQIFDCIEFCPEFRNIDVIYDVAFMVMDLDFHDRSDLANIFLNTYLEITGDYEGAILLPAYLSMRATIRGNVNSMTAADPAIPPSEQADHWHQAQQYFHLAYLYTQRPQGQIVIMSGLSGSGKSTVAHRLAPQSHAIHIRSDAVRKHLARMPLHELGTEAIYTPAMTEKTYQRLIDLGLLLAQEGWTVILDAKFDQRSWRTAVMEQAKTAQIKGHILYCTASLDTLITRLHHRAGDISDATADLLQHQQQGFQPFSQSEQQHVTTLDTQKNWDTQLTSFIESLAKWDDVRLT